MVSPFLLFVTFHNFPSVIFLYVNRDILYDRDVRVRAERAQNGVLPLPSTLLLIKQVRPL